MERIYKLPEWQTEKSWEWKTFPKKVITGILLWGGLGLIFGGLFSLSVAALLAAFVLKSDGTHAELASKPILDMWFVGTSTFTVMGICIGAFLALSTQIYWINWHRNHKEIS